ncbi:SANT/Myb domain [Dillenia turbinata]|uniref:SANT/Myb domain n=1 Tax=Dillenia turbinata TaxID=194707 RepID=A0AAN8WC99_9MAGN
MAHQAGMQGEKLRKGPWLEEEDQRLTAVVNLLGERRWDYIARISGLKRSGKSCRLRWMNYLRPNLRHDPISPEEEQIILQLHARWGNRWSKIAKKLPGRTDNEIKNYFRSHLRRKAQIQEQGKLSTSWTLVLVKVYSSVFSTGNRCIAIATCNAEEDFSTQKGETSLQKTYLEDCRSIEDNQEPGNDSCEVLGFLDVGFASSPYETRISDWISTLTDDQSASMDFSFGYPTWIKDGDYATCDWSDFLWQMDCPNLIESC